MNHIKSYESHSVNSELLDYFIEVEDYDISITSEIFNFRDFYVNMNLINHRLFFKGLWFDVMSKYYKMVGDNESHDRMIELERKQYALSSRFPRKVFKDCGNIECVRIIMPNYGGNEIVEKMKFKEMCLQICSRIEKVSDYRLIDHSFYFSGVKNILVGDIFFFRENDNN